MPRRLISQPVEKGATEVWKWNTDLLVNVERGEQAIALRDYPRETLSLQVAFGDDGQDTFEDEVFLSGQDAILRNLTDNILAEGEVEVPIWWLAEYRVGGHWNSGTQTATLILSEHTPFFAAVGEEVLVRNETTGTWLRAEVTGRTLASFSYDIDFGSDTGWSFADIDLVAPLRTGLAKSGASTSFERAAHVASTSLSVQLDRSQGRTGLSNGVDLNQDTPGGYPLVEPRGIIDGLELGIDPGLETIDTPTGFPYAVTHWTEAKFDVDYRDSFAIWRQGERAAYWRTFFATVKGSQGIFWLPTRRGEFTVLAADNDAQNITLQGRQYYDLWNASKLKALCLDGGGDLLVVRQVTGVALSGDDTVCEFGDDWFDEPVLQCSLVFPVRLDGDTVSWKHDDQSSLEFRVTSVVYDYPIPEEEVDWDGLLANYDANQKTSGIAGEIGGTVSALGTGNVQTAVNGLRALAFEDVTFDPTLGGTLDLWLWTDTKLAQFRDGDIPGPADMQVEGQGEVPMVYILPGGEPTTPLKPLGVARYIKAWSGPPFDEPLGPSRATAPSRQEDGWKALFADVGYYDPYWRPYAKGLNDRSGNGNHLTAVGPHVSYRDSASERYRLHETPGDGSLQRTFDAPLSATAKLVAMVGHIDADPGGVYALAFFQSDTDTSSVYRDTDGNVWLTRAGLDNTIVGQIDIGDWFLLLGIFDGASSSIHLLKNDDAAWADESVDDGGGAATAAINVGFGCPQSGTHACLLSEVPADLLAYREGLARYYGFNTLESDTGIALTPANIDGWKVLHDGTTDYVLSVVLRLNALAKTTSTLFEVLNDAENGGLRWTWNKATSELTVTYIGVAGTFAETFDLTAYASDKMLAQLKFTAATGGSAQLCVNGDSQGTFTPTGFTYSAVQQNSLKIGRDRGWTFCELELRSGSSLTTTLDEQWDVDV